MRQWLGCSDVGLIDALSIHGLTDGPFGKGGVTVCGKLCRFAKSVSARLLLLRRQSAASVGKLFCTEAAMLPQERPRPFQPVAL